MGLVDPSGTVVEDTRLAGWCHTAFETRPVPSVPSLIHQCTIDWKSRWKDSEYEISASDQE